MAKLSRKGEYRTPKRKRRPRGMGITGPRRYPRFDNAPVESTRALGQYKPRRSSVPDVAPAPRIHMPATNSSNVHWFRHGTKKYGRKA